MAETLAPGFRFYPTEEELISFYLMNKLEGERPDMHRVIPVINIPEVEPWHLPEHAGQSCRDDTEQWFFFMPRQEREARGGRPTRKTASGYWKATGSPNYVYSSDNRVIGLKKTMVFYKGKAPTGRKTKWKMNEYRAIKHEGQNGPFGSLQLRHEFSLCRVYVTSGSCRSFDRRPAGAAVMEIKDQKVHENKTAMSSSKNSIPTSSPEGSGLDRDNVALLDQTDVEINNHNNKQEEQLGHQDDSPWTLWEGSGLDRDNVALLDQTDVEINNHNNKQEEQLGHQDDLPWTLWEEIDWP